MLLYNLNVGDILKYNIILSKNDNYQVIFDMNHDSLKHTLLEES